MFREERYIQIKMPVNSFCNVLCNLVHSGKNNDIFRTVDQSSDPVSITIDID